MQVMKDHEGLDTFDNWPNHVPSHGLAWLPSLEISKGDLYLVVDGTLHGPGQSGVVRCFYEITNDVTTRSACTLSLDSLFSFTPLAQMHLK